MKRIFKISVLILLVICMPALDIFSSSLEALDKDLEAVAEKVLPSVVSTMGEADGAGSRGIFGRTRPGESRKSMGSGVIIDKRGYIVTNYHVIRELKEINIVLFDKKEYRCEVVGSDPATDIAVLKIKGKVPKALPVIEMADSDKLAPGQIAIAVGNSFGLSHTVTMGIVSAVNRDNIGLLDFENLIQTDAAINPGNSGGALVNVKGQLIGINTAIYTRSGGSDGLGFAIPSNQVRSITDELIRTGKIVRGFLGVLVEEIGADDAKRLKAEEGKGVRVTGVVDSSPAEKAGLRADDIIYKVNGKSVATVKELRVAVSGLKPGTVVKFDIFREGRVESVKVTLAEVPVPKQAKKDNGFSNFGMSVTFVDEDSSYRYKITEKHGAVVTKVSPASPASLAGINPGDLIQEVEGTVVTDSIQFEEAIRERAGRSTVSFLVLRGNIRRNIVVVLDK